MITISKLFILSLIYIYIYQNKKRKGGCLLFKHTSFNYTSSKGGNELVGDLIE